MSTGDAAPASTGAAGAPALCVDADAATVEVVVAVARAAGWRVVADGEAARVRVVGPSKAATATVLMDRALPTVALWRPGGPSPAQWLHAGADEVVVLQGLAAETFAVALACAQARHAARTADGDPAAEAAAGARRRARDDDARRAMDRTRAEWLHLALRGARAGAWSWSLQPRALTWSPEMFGLCGFEPGDGPPPYEDWARRVHPDDLPLLQAQIERALRAEGDGFEVAFRLRPSPGVERSVLSIGRLQRDASGRPRRLSGIDLDVTERERARESERESDRLLRAVIAATTDLVWAKDADGRITLANQATADLLGDGRIDAVVGRPLDALVADAAMASRVIADDRRVAAAGRTETVEELLGPPGRARLLQSVKSPLRDERGRVVGLVGVSRDVTDDRARARRLADREAQLRLALDTADLMLSRLSLTTGRLWLSVEFARWLRLPLDPDADGTEMPVEDAWSMVHPDDRVRVRERLADLDGALRSEHRLRTADGVRWVSMTGRTLRDAEGRPTQVLWVTQDVTRRKVSERLLARTHRRLEESFALLDALFERAPIGLTFLDTGFRYVRVNRMLADLNGLPVAAHIGRTVAEVLPGVWPAVQPLLEQVRDRGEPIVARPVRAPVPGRAAADGDDADSWWLAGYYPVRVRGELFGYGIVALDVTDQTRAQIALREADRRKDDFLATLAHELRNPLAPISHAVHVLRAAAPDARTAPLVGIVERQVAHMVRLIDDLLDVSRISRNKIALRRVRTDLVDAVATAVETSRPAIDQRGHRLRVNVDGGPLPVQADPVRLSQVVANLLNNAARYTPRGGHIDVRCGRDGDEAVVTVRDDGIGIDAQRLPDVFDMFTQVHGADSPSQGGLGIGLWLVRHLVTLHGGRVQADSDGRGHGACFTVRLPLADAPVAAEPDRATPAAPAVPPQPARDAPLRVLVVDDNADSAGTLGMLLELDGHTVRTCGDGPSALVEAESLRPDVVLLDIGMPGMDGLAVCRALRARPWGTDPTLIALTGWGQAADRERSQAAGFDHHLTKPVDLERLRGLMRRR